MFVGFLRKRWLIVVLVVAAAATIGFGRSPSLGVVHVGDFASLGSADAPVVITEFSDFQCPYCVQHARSTLPRIIEEYVERGLVRVQWRHFPIFGSDSFRAAAAAEAAREQDHFWEYHDLLLNNQKPRGSGALSEGNLIFFAEQLKLNIPQFTATMRSESTLELVNADLDAGTRAGVRSTPSFVINDTAVSGAHPFEVFSEVIEEALSKQ